MMHLTTNEIIGYLTAIVLIISSDLITIKSAEANALIGVPDDVFGINMTSVNYELFDVVDAMTDITNRVDEIDLQDYIRKLSLLIWRVPVIDISTMHRYDSYEDKLISGGPKTNKTECKAKLNHLVSRVTKEQANGSSLVDTSNDYRLFNLLDSFGRPSSSFLDGDILWLGNYDKCLKAKYNYRNNTLSNSRYCLAHLRWPHWKHTEGFKEWTYTTVKSAICLPDSCDSLTAENEQHKQLIAQLMGIHFGSAYKNFQIGNIYCLPDKESSLTQWWSETDSTVCVLFYFIWMSLIMIATVMDTFHRKSTFVNMFSFVSNTKKLFNVSKKENLIEGDGEKQSTASLKLLRRGPESADNGVSSRDPMKKLEPIASNSQKVDLNYLHCIKVILIFIVMKAHFFLFLTPASTIYNSAVSFKNFDIYYLGFAGMMVNVFFVITGTLVAFLIFEKFQPFRGQESRSMVSSKDTEQTGQIMAGTHPLMRPSVWLGFCLNRYLRVMPLLATLTLTVKYLGKYLGEGPLWDYGTSTGTNSHMCREESLSLLFLGIMNLKPVYQNCIASSWYLSIDLQCAIIVAPIVIIAYIKAPRVTFFVSLTLPFLHFFHYIMTDTYIPDEVRAITIYGEGNLGTFAIFAHELGKLYYYTPARAIYFIMGITSGYMLHIYSFNSHDTSERKNSLESSESTTKLNASHVRFIRSLIKKMRKPILSNWWLGLTILSFTMIFLVWMLKFLPERYLLLPTNLATIHFNMGLIVLVYTFIIPVLLIQFSTGSLANGVTIGKFLNWSGWLPLSRISLTFLLVDPILVALYNFRLKHSVVMDMEMRIVIMIAQSIFVYLATFLIHILLEMPIQSALMIVQMKLLRRLAQRLN